VLLQNAFDSMKSVPLLKLRMGQDHSVIGSIGAQSFQYSLTGSAQPSIPWAQASDAMATHSHSRSNIPFLDGLSLQYRGIKHQRFTVTTDSSSLWPLRLGSSKNEYRSVESTGVVTIREELFLGYISHTYTISLINCRQKL